MTRATRLEAYMLSLINAERAGAGRRPLTFDGDLNQSADAHTGWMLAGDVFSHDGAGGSTLRDRVEDAGYFLTGNWSIGENLGLRSQGGARGLRDEVRAIHDGLMGSPSHRDNILSRSYDEVGIGIRLGEYKGMTVVMVTQDFGRTGADGQAARGASAAPAVDDFVFARTAGPAGADALHAPAAPAGHDDGPHHADSVPVVAPPMIAWDPAPWSHLL